jgi:5'-methylthioadenosine phosphorylase
VPEAAAEIGVFGGSGFYAFLDDVSQLDVTTPFGPPSAPVAVGELGGRRVAFLARHGTAHELPPQRVNYRANVWAMYSLGVRRLFGPCAAGSLQRSIGPGDFVVCDQLVDRTTGRADTFYEGPQVHHVSFAEPYCPELRRVLVDAARDEELVVHDGGTVVSIQGPRFSTRAESEWFAAAGWHVVNMTQYPEAYLARELGICYATAALVTDYDAALAGVDGIESVTMEQVFAVFNQNLERLRTVLFRAIPAIPDPAGCACHTALAVDRLSPGPVR